MLHKILAIKPEIIADAPTDIIVADVGNKDIFEHLTRSHGNKCPHKVPDKKAQIMLPDTNAPNRRKRKIQSKKEEKTVGRGRKFKQSNNSNIQ